MSKRLLIVDDELDIQSSLSFALKDEGYSVVTATLPAEAEKLLEEHEFDLGLFDVWFPEGDGIELLRVTKERKPQLPVVMMSGHGNIELALKSIRLGAYDFLEKPLELDKVLVVIANAIEASHLRRENLRLHEELRNRSPMMGSSPALKQLKDDVSRVASSQSHVLITGENGSGKEVVARLLHASSARAREPFVVVNCAALAGRNIESELFGHEKNAVPGADRRFVGRFEQAGAGTLFLDEVSELSPTAQAKLLRVLDERVFERVGGHQTLKCEARIVAATQRNLSTLVKEGRFREDLFHRLNVLCLRVPPLRQRGQDILELAEFFLTRYASELGVQKTSLSPELREVLVRHDWPGNVRELKNLVERMVLMRSDDGALGVADLPEELQPPQSGVLAPLSVQDPSGSLRELRARFESSIIRQRLDSNAGNVTRTAASLGVERAHLHRKLKQYGLQKGEECESSS